MPTPTPLISIKHLNVTYFAGRSNEVRALRDISLEIFPGEFIIFFGPSGCGKSTLLYSIAGLERHVEGSILVKDKDLADMALHELEEYHQSAIGMIFQSFYLINSLSIAQNVALPQVAVRGNYGERMKKSHDLLERFGVGAQANKLPSELSGGQQQRVAICRSLMNDPDILIADEPVGNLDSKSSEEVMKLLRHLNDNEKKTVILVTHDPSHLRHAHRIFYLRDGQITGTKTNTSEEREANVQESLATPLSTTTLAHWAQAYAGGSAAGAETAMVSHKIMAEVFTGLTADELAEIEQCIGRFIEEKHVDKRTIVELLHAPVKQGGIGMNKIKAERLATEIARLVGEVNAVQSMTPDGDSLTLTAAEAQEIRCILLHEFDLDLTGRGAVHAMDDILRQRLEGSIDRTEVQRLLNLPVAKNGAGIHARNARKISRRLEPFVTYHPADTTPDPASTVSP